MTGCAAGVWYAIIIASRTDRRHTLLLLLHPSFYGICMLGTYMQTSNNASRGYERIMMSKLKGKRARGSSSVNERELEPSLRDKTLSDLEILLQCRIESPTISVRATTCNRKSRCIITMTRVRYNLIIRYNRIPVLLRNLCKLSQTLLILRYQARACNIVVP